jgi:hypothetical protein
VYCDGGYTVVRFARGVGTMTPTDWDTSFISAAAPPPTRQRSNNSKQDEDTETEGWRGK